MGDVVQFFRKIFCNQFTIKGKGLALKRFFCFVIALALISASCAVCCAEEDSSPEEKEVHYFVTHEIGYQTYSNPDQWDTVLFGQEVTILENQGENCLVEYE